MIRTILQKEPMRIPETLWNILRSISPIRTPEEEQIECFGNSEACAPETCFARTMERALKACLAVIPQPKHVEVQFVRNERSAIDVIFDSHRNVLKIHQRWLDFNAVHRTPCRDLLSSKVAEQEGSFFCDHVVEELIKISLPQITRPVAVPRGIENTILRQIRNSLRYMPHSIKVIQTSQRGCLMITWEDNETESFRKHPASKDLYHVVLHEENCVDAKAELLHGGEGTSYRGIYRQFLLIGAKKIYSVFLRGTCLLWMSSAICQSSEESGGVCQLAVLSSLLSNDCSEPSMRLLRAAATAGCSKRIIRTNNTC